MASGYNTHLNYEKILGLLSKNKCTAEYFIKETKIPTTTVYRIIKSLIHHKIISVNTTRSKKRPGAFCKVFKLCTIEEFSK